MILSQECTPDQRFGQQDERMNNFGSKGSLAVVVAHVESCVKFEAKLVSRGLAQWPYFKNLLFSEAMDVLSSILLRRLEEVGSY